MEFFGEGLDAFAHIPGEFGEFGVLAHQFHELGSGGGGGGLTLFAGMGEGLAMLGVGIGVGFVAVSLAGLREQDERRGVSGLQAERQIEQNERIDVEMENAGGVEEDPDADDHGLRHQENGRAEKSRERLRFEGEPIVAEWGRQVAVRLVEAEMMFVGGRTRGGQGGVGWRFHDHVSQRQVPRSRSSSCGHHEV